jgi:tetratricopeptide (TPR) repeat protein
MYLRTPKRYRRGQKRSPISLRWLWLWLLTPVVVLAGVQIYNNRDTIGAPIHQALYNVVDNAQSSLATANAPTPIPTTDPAERLERAEADWREGRIESALDAYQAVLPSVPNDVEAYYRVALGLLMEGRLEEALDAAERTVTADPFSSDAWAIRAMVLDWNGRYGEAVASALHALELNPDSARATAFLAEAYYDIDQPGLAQSTIERALELDPNSFEALRVRGLIAQVVEFDNQTAQTYYQAAYDEAPNLPYLAIDLARSYYTLQNYDDAIAILRDIVEVNPQNSLALFELGSYYYNAEGNFTQAAEFLGRCVEANPESVLCQALLGRVQISLEDYIAASESLQRAIDLGTTNPRHFLWAGRARIAQGNCPGAAVYLQRGYELAQDGSDPEALVALTENLRECQVNIPGLAEVTPEATAETQSG